MPENAFALSRACRRPAGGRPRFWLIWTLLAAMVMAALAAPVMAQPASGIYREVFYNIAGSSVATLTNNSAYPNAPGFDEVVTNYFEAPSNVAENFGQRMRALLLPPTTGAYTFWISSDDNSELWLSTNESPTNRQLVATMKSSTTSRNFTKETNQMSAPVSLVANQRYYVEALMKEGTGGDNLAVRWQLPGGTWESAANTNLPIPGSRLIPAGLAAPVIAEQPGGVTVVEGQATNLYVRLVRLAGAQFQWRRNGADIPGATNNVLNVGPVTLADNGMLFSCAISNWLGSTSSTAAQLTVLPDTTPPTVFSVGNLADPEFVTVTFSEAVESTSAGLTSNYAISGGITVLSATLGTDGCTVLLAVTPMTLNGAYTLSVSNVRDRAATPNTIASNTERSFALSITPLPMSLVKGHPEPPGPSSRRGPLVISEVMYHPPKRSDGRNLEFIEIYNAHPWFEDLSGFRISGAISYSFPTNFTLGPRSFALIAKEPPDIFAAYGKAALGPWTGSLQNSSGALRIENPAGAVMFEMDYSGEPPFPAAADGAGHTLVLTRPSFGERDPRAWAASDMVAGTPGTNEASTANSYSTVMINELLAHTDIPQQDYVELFNYSSQAVNLAGCVLTDDPTTNRFVIPTNTILPALGFVAFTEEALGFGLSAAGETIFLKNPQGSRVIDAIQFGAQENGVALGRYPDGAPALSRLQYPTPGANNSPMRLPPVVISEIMYHPVSETNDDEYVELLNTTASPINLAGWRIEGAVNFTLPSNAAIASSGYLVVAANGARLRAQNPSLTASTCFGNWQGALRNSGERIALSMPDQIIGTNASGAVSTNTIHIVMDEITYGDGGRWGRWTDGGGSSLELRDSRADRRLAPNWADSDESRKSPWATVEATGMMTNGYGDGAYQLHINLLGAGECLIDNVEVVPVAGANLVANGAFEQGLEGWVFQGNHNGSSWEAGEGYAGGRSLHLRATGRGDTGANRARAQLLSAPAPGTMITIRAKVRWLKGHPNLLLRMRGNWMEAAGLTLAANNLGTPGARNSAAKTNAPPAITDVAHWPPLPATNQPVLVTARVSDADGLALLLLKYRVDPATNYQVIAMANNGAGYFSGTIPGQVSNVMAAFFIEAADKLSPFVFSRFPEDAPQRECNVLWGDTAAPGSLGTYRIWITQTNIARWANEEKMSNKPKDVTFVYGTNRVVYNAGAWFHGSPYHSPSYTSPTGANCDYDMLFPNDDRLLGETDINLFRPGNGGSDNTGQAEIHAYWFGGQFGVPYLYHRPVFLLVNGQLRRQSTATIFHDAQQPNGDFAAEWFPDDPDGEVHKVQVGFEFGDQAYGTGEPGFSSTGANLNRYLTTGGAFFQPRYRQTLPLRSVSPWQQNNYTSVFALVTATMTNAAIGTEAYTAALTNLVDVPEWYKTHVTQHLYENVDSFSYGGGQNAFLYKPQRGTWKLMLWDVDFAFNGPCTNTALFGIGGADHGPRNDHAPFRRIYWQMLAQAADTFMQPNRSAPLVDARYAGLIASGAIVSSPQSIKTAISNKLSVIRAQVPTVIAPFSITSGANVTATQNLVSISGTAPIDVRSIEINGIAYQPVWTSITNWTITLALPSGTNTLTVIGRDLNGSIFSNSTTALTVNVTAPEINPQDYVSISEIMFNPVMPGAEYVEIYNRSAGASFDLSGWKLNGVDYTFPPGLLLGPRQYVVIVKDLAAFSSVYGAVPVLGVYGGNLEANGESLSLVKPGPMPSQDIVVDKVRYDNSAPWPLAPPGASVQLIDAAQDNARVGNWTSSFVAGETNSGWRFVSVTGKMSGDSRLILYGDYIGALYLDDISLVAGSNAGMGYNFVRNGDFESPLDTNAWVLGTNMLRSAIDSANTHSGAGALRMIFDAPGASANGRFMLQSLLPAPTNQQLCTLSFWVWATNNTITNVSSRVISSTISVVSNVQIAIKPPTNFATPGTVNFHAASLPTFPSVWINEVLDENATSLRDAAGDAEPWLELYNPGTNSVSLDGLYLANNLTNLLQWGCPTGISIGPHEFRLIFLDGETNESSAAEIHASFRLVAGVGLVALSRLVNGATQVVDYVRYAASVDHSFGSFPDGQPFDRQEFYYATPAATNNPTLPAIVVSINEWMADNTLGISDPADGDFEDWFELYNPGSNAVSLSGYYLTDTLTNRLKYQIPAGYSIPPGGWLLVWADGEPGQNSPSRPDLHAGFSLSKWGEAIGLFTPEGLQIDAVVFGAQTSDLAMGRFPDGSAAIVSLTNSTPRAANFYPLPNTPPSIASLSDQAIIEGQTLGLTAAATDADLPRQRVSWSLGNDAPASAIIDSATGAIAWRPGEMDGGQTFVFPIIATDDGVPPLSATQTFHVTVVETNSPPGISAMSAISVSQESLLSFVINATDSDLPGQNLAFHLDPGAPTGAAIDASSGLFTWTPTAAQAGVYQISVRVRDDGAPPLDDSAQITITVNEVIDPPFFVAIATTTNAVRLIWPSIHARQYTVEYKDSTEQGGWLPLADPIPATNAVLSFEDVVGPAPQRLYRVRMQR